MTETAETMVVCKICKGKTGGQRKHDTHICLNTKFGCLFTNLQNSPNMKPRNQHERNCDKFVVNPKFAVIRK